MNTLRPPPPLLPVKLSAWLSLTAALATLQTEAASRRRRYNDRAAPEPRSGVLTLAVDQDLQGGHPPKCIARKLELAGSTLQWRIGACVCPEGRGLPASPTGPNWSPPPSPVPRAPRRCGDEELTPSPLYPPSP